MQSMRTFYHLLFNSAIASITNYTVWFAIVFYVYLETKSVFATSMIGGLFLVITAGTSIWFGSLVDHHRKKTMMLISSLTSLGLYIISFALYLTVPEGTFTSINNVMLWVFIVCTMLGVMAGNIRNIALPTIVTLLVPEDGRANANGMVGIVSGISFGLVSAISGVLVGLAGMYYVFIIALSLTVLAMVHLLLIHVVEKKIVHLHEEGSEEAKLEGKVDLRGTFTIVRGIPGLLSLIIFGMFNNFLGGVFMALMDPYGLSLVRVEVWGFIFAGLSFGFIIGGSLIAKWGVGKNPLRTIFIMNIVTWTVSSVFTIQASIILLVIGMFIWMVLTPFVEAAEQTILQKVVPYERQGRVFGFAQSVEQSASPLMAFLIGPITQFIFIPFMTTGAGVELIGGWYGVGPARGMALVFSLAGIVGLIVTLLSFRSTFYKRLSRYYLSASAAQEELSQA